MASFRLGNRHRQWLRGEPRQPSCFESPRRQASRLRGNAARRKLHEGKAAESATEVVAGVAWDDLGEALHEEIGRLPGRYRVPLVLCYLEGLTAEQVARQLGWPPGTVRSRLDRGRALSPPRLRSAK